MGVLARLAVALVACILLAACGEGELTAFSSQGAPGGGGSENGSGAQNVGVDIDGSVGPRVYTTALIDDFEDGDSRVTPDSESWWYIFNDSTGEQEFVIEDVSGQREGSAFAAHTWGGHFTAWGAGLGVDLAGIQDARSPGEPFDATQFAGISFWARVEASSVRETRVDLLNPCGDNCVAYSGVNIQLAQSWRQYTVLFSELEPRQDSDFDQSQLLHLQFFFLDPESFDLWVDDLAVVSKYSIK